MIEVKHKITKEDIYSALDDVKDPEIPTISVVELGIISDVQINENETVSITMTPTFAGCPAIKMIESNVKERKLSIKTPIASCLLGKKVGDQVEVKVPSGTKSFEIIEISRRFPNHAYYFF